MKFIMFLNVRIIEFQNIFLANVIMLAILSFKIPDSTITFDSVTFVSADISVVTWKNGFSS